MNGGIVLAAAAVLFFLAFALAVWRHVQRQRRLRRRAWIYAEAEIRQGEDRRMLVVAEFYGMSISEVRSRMADGCQIMPCLGRLLLFPPASPMPLEQPGIVVAAP